MARTNVDIFREIYQQRWWGDDGRDFHSGNIPAVLSPYIGGVRRFLSQRPEATVVDVGTGDFEAGGRLVDLTRLYRACDVVPELIERNRRLYGHSKVEFHVIDATQEPLPSGEVVIVKQVLQHLSNNQISAVLERLEPFRTWLISEHVPLGAFTPNIDLSTGAGVRADVNSGVVVTEPPFSIEPRSSEVLSEAYVYGAIIRTVVYLF